MAGYNNRVGCKPCNKPTEEVKPVEPVTPEPEKPVEPSKPTETAKPVSKGDSLGSIECQDKKILSITKVGDKVIVMYDDCSYQTADEKVVALESMYGDMVFCLEGRIDELQAQIEVLKAKPDQDTIYDDTSVKQRLTALESKEDKDTIYDDSAIKQQIEQIRGSIPDVSRFVTGEQVQDKITIKLTEALADVVKESDLVRVHNLENDALYRAVRYR